MAYTSVEIKRVEYYLVNDDGDDKLILSREDSDDFFEVVLNGTSESSPPAETLPVFNVANHNAILDGVVSAPNAAQNSIALAETIDEAEQAYGEGLILIPGLLVIDDQFFLNNPSFGTTLLSYHFFGFGKRSTILLRAGLDAQYLFLHNSNDTAGTGSTGGVSGPQQPNVTIEGICFDLADAVGSYTIGPSLLYTYLGSGIHYKRSRMKGLQYGIRTDGYTDMCYIADVKSVDKPEFIAARSNSQTGYVFYQGGPGDNHTVERVSAGAGAATNTGAHSDVGGGAGVCRFYQSKGSIARNITGGSLEVNKCNDVRLSNMNFDDNSTLPNKANITLIDSSVTAEEIRRNAADNSSDQQAMITIDDTAPSAVGYTPGKGTTLRVRDSGGKWSIRAAEDVHTSLGGTSTGTDTVHTTHARTPDLYLKSVNDNTRVIWEKDDARCNTSDSAFNMQTAPLRIVAPTTGGTAGEQADRTAIRDLARDEAHKFRWEGWMLAKFDAVWDVRAYNGIKNIKTMPNPTVPAPVNAANLYSSLLAIPAGVKYRVQYYEAGLGTQVVESSSLASATHQAIILTFTQNIPPCEIRFWKSVDGGLTWPQFCSFYHRGGPCIFYDDGEYMQGRGWRTSGYLIPAPAAGGVNSTLNGLVLHNGNKICYGIAEPTAGLWLPGDEVKNIGGGVIWGWGCIDDSPLDFIELSAGAVTPKPHDIVLNTANVTAAFATANRQTWPNASRSTIQDLSLFTQCRIQARTYDPFSSGTKFAIQYTLVADETSGWKFLDDTADASSGATPSVNVYVDAGTDGNYVTPWVSMPAAMIASAVHLRMVTLDGDGVTTGTMGRVALQVR